MEIEVKLKYRNKKAIIGILKDNGFRLSAIKEIRDWYFGQSGQTMSKQNRLIRIRDLVGKRTEITLKDDCIDNQGVWCRKEISVEINDAEVMKEILISVGCTLIKENFSKREIWEKGDLILEFISFSKPARLEIIEVEGPNEKVIKKMLMMLKGKVRVVGEEVFSVFDKKT